MSLKLKFEDFKLDNIHQVVGGKQGPGGVVWEPTETTCTSGDEGCCDDSHTDDAKTCG